MNSLLAYTIKLPQFEGPFDLLIFFIERDELDIYDIPISKITEDFLNYIRTMESLNIDMASEFIVMAATLMQIKARMLLPRKEFNEQGEEIDPRQQLIDRLIEYKKYKDLVPEFQSLELERSKKKIRGNVKVELRSLVERAQGSSEMENLNLYKLMEVFHQLMQKHENTKNKKKAVILRFDYNLRDEKKSLRKRLASFKKMRFEKIFDVCKDRIHAIVLFLAMLDMINEQAVAITQGEGLNNFWIESKSLA